MPGSGSVSLDLTGADFEFVNKVSLVDPANKRRPPRELSFIKGEDKTNSLETELDASTLKPGRYLMRLSQLNGTTHDVPVTVLPPAPKIEDLPLRVNLGEPQQTLVLKGTGLNRIEQMTSKGAVWKLGALPGTGDDLMERDAAVTLAPEVKQGERLDIALKVAGMTAPLQLPGALLVAGPRPRILGVKISFPQEADVALREAEIPAGSSVSFVIQAANLGPQPSVRLQCYNPFDTKAALALRPGIRNGLAELDFAGEDSLYLLLDPGVVGQSGCKLTATLTNHETGTSDPYTLGSVERLPRISKFTLTSQKLGESLYVGVVTGRDLQMIEKTGWTAQTGFPVQGIPTPVPGSAQEQTLRIELPWPPPEPLAPLYIWLRGENAGRLTQARY